jgi:hypothetical protein
MQESPQQYMKRIFGQVEGKEPLRLQSSTAQKLAKLIKGLDKKQLTYHAAPGKWSIAEILAHLADTELVAGWRMRLVLGQNGAVIQAFDQDIWAGAFNYGRRRAETALEMFRVLRDNNLLLLKSVPKELWANYGMHQERGKETISQMIRMFAGHDLNHLRQVEQLAAHGRAKPRKKRA